MSNVEMSEGSSAIIDFSGVEDVKFELIPNGKYPCVIADIEATYSSNGNPMWSLQMEITDGDYTGRKLFTHIVFSPKAMPFTKITLSRIAPALLEQAFEFDNPDIYSQFQGMDVIAQVGLQKYEGENRNTVKGLFAASGL